MLILKTNSSHELFLLRYPHSPKMLIFFPKSATHAFRRKNKKNKSLPSPDPLLVSPPPGLLLHTLNSVVVLQPAWRPLCPRVSTERENHQNRGGSAVSPVRNYAPRNVWHGCASRTDGGISMKVGQQAAPASKLLHNLCAPLPPVSPITLGSHSTTSERGRGGGGELCCAL